MGITLNGLDLQDIVTIAIALAFFCYVAAVRINRPVIADLDPDQLTALIQRLQDKDIARVLLDSRHHPDDYQLPSSHRPDLSRQAANKKPVANRSLTEPLPLPPGRASDHHPAANRSLADSPPFQGRDGDRVNEARALVDLARQQFGSGRWVPAQDMRELYDMAYVGEQPMHWTVLGCALKDRAVGLQQADKRNIVEGQKRARCYFIPGPGLARWELKAKREKDAAQLQQEAA